MKKIPLPAWATAEDAARYGYGTPQDFYNGSGGIPPFDVKPADAEEKLTTFDVPVAEPVVGGGFQTTALPNIEIDAPNVDLEPVDKNIGIDLPPPEVLNTPVPGASASETDSFPVE